MKQRPSIVPVLLVVAMLSPAAAAAQPASSDAGRRIELWARAGLFLPTEDAFGEVYSGARVPLVVDGEWRLHRLVAVFGGVRYMRTTGEVIAEGDGGSGGSASATRLTMTSGRLGGIVAWPSGPWDVRFGAGLTVNHYSEDWPDAAGASVSGTRAGWLVQGGVARRIGRRWAAGVSVEYSGATVPEGSGEFAVPALDLGGLDVLFGVAIRF
jgi:hypothetical protein